MLFEPLSKQGKERKGKWELQAGIRLVKYQREIDKQGTLNVDVRLMYTL